ncbi:type II secretion system inner membrane protein GspF [Simiduia curdlanivorans]|uniref:General secretion pathway protein F n=1 Tax=Simiduia curdlanivorans TaxID=1492769 RepID=A0ABV8UZJ5_9GAMM|nr:type II secretion system inner membrane protein GspF [Simiduia curdlanivorans]MDN3638050.1 type II secretion system inner membrane protein GspF [Simiduia curdlanivorans]
MPAFSYQAIDENGRQQKGVVEGDSERSVRAELRGRNLKPINVKVASGGMGREVPSLSFSFRMPKFHRRIKDSELTVLTRQMSSLLNSGMPLVEALQSTANQQRKQNLKEMILHVRSRVLEGHSFAQALAEAPHAFDSMYRALVRAGESAGYLGPVLERLAAYTEATFETRQRVRMAMIYPVVLLVVSMGVIAMLMTFVVPELTSVFAHSHRELPTLTIVLITVSNYLSNWGLWSLLALLLAIMGLQKWLQKPSRTLRWHGIILRLPVFGEISAQINSARFASTLSLLTGSGVPLLDAIKISTQVMTNAVMAKASEKLAVDVQEGSSLSRAMEKTKLFPPLLVQMTASGESSGDLDKQLEHAARNMDRELEWRLAAALGIMEPMVVVVMGILVTGIVMAILLPIFEMNTMV